MLLIVRYLFVSSLTILYITNIFDINFSAEQLSKREASTSLDVKPRYSCSGPKIEICLGIEKEGGWVHSVDKEIQGVWDR
jgi:hypothetical protein